MKYMILMAGVLSALAVLGCEKKQEAPKESPKASPPSAPAAAKAPAKPKDDHDHKPGETHADEHKEGDGHDHGHGEEHELGTVEIAGFQVRAVGHGKIVAGAETDVDVFVSGGQGMPSAVRLWIGSVDGKGAMKMKAAINKDEAHNHVAVPSPISADAKLCIELELAGGEKKVGTLPLHK